MHEQADVNRENNTSASPSVSLSSHLLHLCSAAQRKGSHVTEEKAKGCDLCSTLINKQASASLPGMFNLSCLSTNSPTRDLRSMMHMRFCNRCESDVEKFTG